MPQSGIEARLLRALRERRLTLACAESLTGGLLGARLTSVPGAGECFVGGAIVYSDDAKTRALGVDAGVIERLGGVSREVAREMAVHARTIFGADIAVALTGFAGPNVPSGGEVGHVIVAIARDTGAELHDLRFGGTRDEIRHACIDEALQLLLDGLAGHEKRASIS